MDAHSDTNCANQSSLSQSTVYLNDSGAQTEKVTAGATTTWHDYIAADGRQVAEHIDNGSPATHLYVADHLGSVAVITDIAGAVKELGSE